MSAAIDGLSSGLDTTSLINALINADALPQTILKNKVTSTLSAVTALQGLNARVALLATLATSIAKPGSLDLYGSTSSSSTITTSVAAGATAGEIDVVVGAIAQTQVNVSAPMTVWASPPVLTIVSSTGVQTEITPASSSLDDVVTAVNASTSGVTASKVASGTDPITGAPQYRLQFASIATGAAASFQLYQGSAAQVTAGTATDVLRAPGAANVRTAQDASVTLWSGTPAQQIVTSATNTFSNLLPGVAVTVSAVSASPITVKVTRDDAQINTVAKSLVDGLVSVFALISAQSAVTTSTAPDGSARVSGGVFLSDSTVRDVNERIMSAASLPVNGHSPSEYGITITKTGTLEFDSVKFMAALVADPATVKGVVQTIASRVADAASTSSDKYVGTLTAKITGQQSLITGLSAQVTEWDGRLAVRRATLQATFSSMEVSLNRLKAQSSWLTSQLSSLSTRN